MPLQLGDGREFDSDAGAEQDTVASGEVDDEVEDNPADGLAYEGNLVVGHEPMRPPSTGRQLVGQSIGDPHRDLGDRFRSWRHGEIVASHSGDACRDTGGARRDQSVNIDSATHDRAGTRRPSVQEYGNPAAAADRYRCDS
ncbi:hypothetical protein [Micromonospora chokoriensis]|uniref:hypothetical protein n=1 Tax=Micromonospora chokoriensis TaxID=356851 RepID=UPI0012FD1A38|nr:hypothetical protein [Micromonospora chokoriensis]